MIYKSFDLILYIDGKLGEKRGSKKIIEQPASHVIAYVTFRKKDFVIIIAQLHSNYKRYRNTTEEGNVLQT